MLAVPCPSFRAAMAGKALFVAGRYLVLAFCRMLFVDSLYWFASMTYSDTELAAWQEGLRPPL